MRKRVLSLALILSLLGTLITGCGDDEEDVSASGADTSSYFIEQTVSDEDTNTDLEDFIGSGLDDFDSSDYYESDLSAFTGKTAQMTQTTIGNNNRADREVDAESFTIMVYICGSDLESEYGAATDDITEMLYSDCGENLNVIIETGGAKRWKNKVISSDALERYAVSGEGLKYLGDSSNDHMMTKEELADFIKFAAGNYPADRYGFIFWDHGGGTLGGYGLDENYDNEDMDIADIGEGLQAGGVHFEFVGFDCCLMGTLETAQAIKDSADYMIASEETEPGTGWYYADFLNMIEENPKVSMKEIGERIIDDFLDPSVSDIEDGVTLSLIDLAEVDNIYDKLNVFFANSNDYLLNDGFTDIAKARSGAKAYGDDEYEQIDIIDYIGRFNIAGANELKEAVDYAVIYNGTNLAGSNGLAMYYPYLYTEYYDFVKSLTEYIGFDKEEYESFFDNFVSVESMAQAGGGNSNPYSSEESEDDYEGIFDSYWFNDDVANEYYNQFDYLDSDTLFVDEKGDDYILHLTDDEWETITDISLEVYMDDGEGYLALGSNDTYSFNQDGDLLVEYDYNWYYLNDCLVPYYYQYMGEYVNGTMYSMGNVPAELNGEKDIEIWIYWEDNVPPQILGYTVVGENNNTMSKGYKKFKNGDVVDFYFDYYDYDGYCDSAYTLTNNQLIFDTSEGLELYYDEIPDYDTEICFHLVDIYQNDYWTESIYYY